MTRDVDPLACEADAAADWAARHRVPWALVFAMRRGASASRSSRWDAGRRAFVTSDGLGAELASHPADDAFWRTEEEARAWRGPAAAGDPSLPVTCECGLVVTCGGDLPLHRMGDVHRERVTKARAAA